MHSRFLIIGCGPTGLGAAYRLKDLGENDYLLVDKADHAGGLASSFKDENGFWWDIGGHVQFSHYKYFDQAMEDVIPKEDWLEHQRESWVWAHDRFVPYPFQNNIRYLPKDAQWECLKGLLECWKNQSNDTPADFEQWIHKIFGAGVAKEFMLPYNFKVWAYPPREMAYQWIGERVAVSDFERILKNLVYENMDASWGPNNTFKFPKYGGTGAIWNSMADKVGREKIRLGSEVVSVNPSARQARLSDGTVVTYDNILSTVPVDKLTRIINGVPKNIVETASRLKHSSSNIVGIGLKGRPPAEIGTKCWMYFPEGNCPFYRVTMFSNYSPYNVPDPKLHFSLMTETSESPVKPVSHSDLVEQTIEGLRATKLIDEDNEIVSRWSYRAEYGYPTPCLNRDAILNTVINYLDGLEVYSRGRFGGWKYEVSNQDHSFMQGVEWVDYMVEGKPETTYTVDRQKAIKTLVKEITTQDRHIHVAMDGAAERGHMLQSRKSSLE